MTRVSVYASALVAFVAATAMLVAAVVAPNWVAYSVTTARGERHSRSVGLHRSCSSLRTPPCQAFPPDELCQKGAERYFCSMWRTVGFMGSLATILCLAGLTSFLVIMRGGRLKRETGWPFVAGMLSLVAAVELVLISMVAYLFDHDGQFDVPGWHLDFSWYLGTFSAVLCILSAAGLALSAYLVPPEEGYEFLADAANG